MTKEPNVDWRNKDVQFADEDKPIDVVYLKRYTAYAANGKIHLAAKYHGEYLDISLPIPNILHLISMALGYNDHQENEPPNIE